MTDDKTESEKVSGRMVIRGAIGFVFGFLAGMLVNPPFAGMTQTSSDVQGLTYMSWFGLGIAGGVLGTLAGVVDFRKLRADRHKGTTDRQM